MIGTKELEYLVKTTLFSGYLEGERPLSLLIAAEVESGKTEMISRFRENKGILFISDASAWGILDEHLDDLSKGTIKHIIIPDLLVPLSRNSDTVNTLIGFLNSLTEEGIKEIRTYAMSFCFPKPIVAGLITAITRKDLNLRRVRWGSIGFMSRLLPVSFSYSQETVKIILDSIAKREYYHDKAHKLNFPTDPTKVDLPPEIGLRLEPLTVAMAAAQEVYGFRIQKQLQRLAMSHALMCGRTLVTWEDFDVVGDLVKYINLNYTKI